MKKILPPLAFVLALIAMALLHALLPVSMLFDSPYRWIGAVLMALGLGATRSGAATFARVQTNIMTFGVPDQLGPVHTNC